MRKLGLACALSCAAFAALVLPLNSVRADEPATFTSWKQMKATQAVLTSQGGRNTDTPARPTRASEQRDGAVPENIPWIMRGTLGMSDTRH